VGGGADVYCGSKNVSNGIFAEAERGDLYTEEEARAYIVNVRAAL
jgi:hypothetical protein